VIWPFLAEKRCLPKAARWYEGSIYEIPWPPTFYGHRLFLPRLLPIVTFEPSSSRPLDPAFPIDRQLAIDANPIVLVNVFTLEKADEQSFLQAWQNDAAFMKQQPGFISTQLHRAIGENPPI
jgi:hypothetical protein